MFRSQIFNFQFSIFRFAFFSIFLTDNTSCWTFESYSDSQVKKNPQICALDLIEIWFLSFYVKIDTFPKSMFKITQKFTIFRFMSLFWLARSSMNCLKEVESNLTISVQNNNNNLLITRRPLWGRSLPRDFIFDFWIWSSSRLWLSSFIKFEFWKFWDQACHLEVNMHA